MYIPLNICFNFTVFSIDFIKPIPCPNPVFYRASCFWEKSTSIIVKQIVCTADATLMDVSGLAVLRKGDTATISSVSNL